MSSAATPRHACSVLGWSRRRHAVGASGRPSCRRRAARGRPAPSSSSSRWVPTWVMRAVAGAAPPGRRAARSRRGGRRPGRWCSASTRRSASSTSFSVCTSSADSVSSRTSTRGLRPARPAPARAAAAGRRTATCPAHRCGCRGPTAGRGRSRPGDLQRLRISSSVASARPSVRFSRALIENSVGSSNAVATSARRCASVEVADVDAVDRHPAAGDVVEPRHQRRSGWSCRSRSRPPARRVSPGRDVEVDVAQHQLVGRVGEGEVDVLEAQVPPVRSTVTALGPTTMSGSVSKISQDARGGGHRLLGHRQDHAERGRPATPARASA